MFSNILCFCVDNVIHPDKNQFINSSFVEGEKSARQASAFLPSVFPRPSPVSLTLPPAVHWLHVPLHSAHTYGRLAYYTAPFRDGVFCLVWQVTGLLAD